MALSLNELIENFELLESWEDRYAYLIELGGDLSPLDESERTEAFKVAGCVSQVWLVPSETDELDPVLTFRGDSDSHLVRGIIAAVFTLFSGKRKSEILALDAEPPLQALGLRSHLTPQRSNGLSSMLSRIKEEAAKENQ